MKRVDINVVLIGALLAWCAALTKDRIETWEQLESLRDTWVVPMATVLVNLPEIYPALTNNPSRSEVQHSGGDIFDAIREYLEEYGPHSNLVYVANGVDPKEAENLKSFFVARGGTGVTAIHNWNTGIIEVAAPDGCRVIYSTKEFSPVEAMEQAEIDHRARHEWTNLTDRTERSE